MIKKMIAIAAVVATLGLTGCASIVNGTNQPVSVNTGSVHGAYCSLSNNKGRWYVANTPGSVVVNRSFADLTVNCQKPGYRNSVTKIASKTKGMVFGNAVFGGLIGAGVDVADGAAYDYPADINVPMARA